MIYPDDAAYYRSRALTEQRRAERSPDPIVAGVHRTLADAYAARAGDPSMSDTATDTPTETKGAE